MCEDNTRFSHTGTCTCSDLASLETWNGLSVLRYGKLTVHCLFILRFGRVVTFAWWRWSLYEVGRGFPMPGDTVLYSSTVSLTLISTLIPMKESSEEHTLHSSDVQYCCWLRAPGGEIASHSYVCNQNKAAENWHSGAMQKMG